MNIEIFRNGTKVQIKWTHGYPVSNFTSTFDFERGTEFDARLCEQEMCNNLDKEIERIRKQAYEKGFNDHKKRKPKATYFSSQISGNDIL